MASAHTRWVAFSVMGSTAAVLCLGLDRFVPGGSFAPGLLSLSDNIEHLEDLEKQIQVLKATVKQLSQSQIVADQVNFSLRLFVHAALFGSFIVIKRFALGKKQQPQEKSVENSFETALESPSSAVQHELDGVKEKQAETTEKIAVLEQRAHSLRQDVREELRKVRQLAGINLARAQA